jgi:hypothetical protein
MKRIFITLLVLTTLFSLQAQSVHDQLVQVAKEGLKDAKEISFRESPAVLQVNEYLIPVSENTNVTVWKEEGNYVVGFALQKGTAVTSTKDPQWRRAAFQLSFVSRQAAQNFVKAFKKAVNNR